MSNLSFAYCLLRNCERSSFVETRGSGINMYPFNGTAKLFWENTDLLTAMNRLGEYGWRFVRVDDDCYIFCLSY